MFCPKCGVDGQKVDAYCKRCGEWLPDMAGFARRALWGQGIKPEQKIKGMLISQAISGALALFSALALFIGSSNAGNAKMLAYVVACVCLVIAACQADSFFVSLRMRQNFRRSRADVELAIGPSAESSDPLFKSPDAAKFAGARKAVDATTRRLDAERTRVTERVE